jgi:hypothetical protein
MSPAPAPPPPAAAPAPLTPTPTPPPPARRNMSSFVGVPRALFFVLCTSCRDVYEVDVLLKWSGKRRRGREMRPALLCRLPRARLPPTTTPAALRSPVPSPLGPLPRAAQRPPRCLPPPRYYAPADDLVLASLACVVQRRASASSLRVCLKKRRQRELLPPSSKNFQVGKTSCFRPARPQRAAARRDASPPKRAAVFRRDPGNLAAVFERGLAFELFLEEAGVRERREKKRLCLETPCGEGSKSRDWCALWVVGRVGARLLSVRVRCCWWSDDV